MHKLAYQYILIKKTLQPESSGYFATLLQTCSAEITR